MSSHIKSGIPAYESGTLRPRSVESEKRHINRLADIMISRINFVDLVQRTFSTLQQLIHMFLPAKLIFFVQSSEQSMCLTGSP